MTAFDFDLVFTGRGLDPPMVPGVDHVDLFSAALDGYLNVLVPRIDDDRSAIGLHVDHNGDQGGSHE